MPQQRKRTLYFVAALAIVVAAVSAATRPRDNTRFVSAPLPTRQQSDGALRALPAGKGDRAAGIAVSPESTAPPAAPANYSGPGGQHSPRATEVAEATGTPAAHKLFSPLIPSGSAGGWPNAAGLLPLPPFTGELPPLPGIGATPEDQSNAPWDYVGTVRLNGVTYALIEERKTRAGIYLKAGDIFRGVHLKAIRTEYVIVAMGGREVTLRKNSGLSEAPSSSASASQAGAAASPPAGAPTQPAAFSASPAPSTAPAYPGRAGGFGESFQPAGAIRRPQRGFRRPTSQGGDAAPAGDSGEPPPFPFPE